MEHTTIAVNLAKSVFQVAVSHRPGHLDEERRLSRDRLLPFFAQQAPATIVLEACGSAHYWARQLQPFGHTVRLLPPHDVRPYVRRNKTDRTDAKGLLEANRNEEIQPVPVKTIEQQAIASLHRLRSTWLATRTAAAEYPPRPAARIRHLHPRRRAARRPPGPCAGREPTPVPVLLRTTLGAACDEIQILETNMRAVEHQLGALASEMADVTLLQTVPGVGVITATALGRARRRHPALSVRAAFRELPRLDAEGRLERVASTARRHQQARRRICAHALDARRPIGRLAREERGPAHAAATVGGADRAAARPQCRRRGRGE